MNYLEDIKAEFPLVRAHMENDLEWENEAKELICEQKLGEAEIKYKKLCISQPEHFAGFEGLFEVYALRKEKNKAEWFIEEAIDRAKKALEEGCLDQGIIDEMVVKSIINKSDDGYTLADSIIFGGKWFYSEEDRDYLNIIRKGKVKKIIEAGKTEKIDTVEELEKIKKIEGIGKSANLGELGKPRQVKRTQTIVREEAKIGRNDPCPCGSGKKYKKCCINK